jgi:tetratricopeptide (TPR) repeat protein
LTSLAHFCNDNGVEMDFNQDNPELEELLEKADEAFDEEKFEDAVKMYGKVLQIEPDHVGALMNRGAAWHSLGRFEKALEDDFKALEQDSEDEKLHFNIGLVLNALDRNEEALDYYDQAIRLRFDYSLAYYARANTLAFLDRHDDAIEDYRKAVQFNVEYEDVYRFWGLSLEKRGRYREAVDHYRRSLEEAEDDSVLCRLGYCFRMIGEDRDAEICLKKAIALDVGENDAIITLAALYHEKGRLEERDQLLRTLSGMIGEDLSGEDQSGEDGP